MLVAGWGVRQGAVSGVVRQPLDLREARRALWVAKWELLLPVIVLVAIFGGFATLVETSAITALYVLFVKVVIHRDIRSGRQLLGAFRDCVTLVGGVMVILGAAMGFTSYLVDVVAAILTAPVSAETARLADERDAVRARAEQTPAASELG